MRYLNIALIGWLLCISVSSIGQTNHDYEIYSVILREFLKLGGAKKKSIIICKDSDTRLFPGDTTIPQLMIKLDSVIKKRIFFDNKFHIKRWKSIVVSGQELFDLIVDQEYNENWKAFYEKYPNVEGVINLSPIYYTNKDKTAGILRVEISRGSLSGGVFIVKFDLSKRRKKRITRTMTLVA